MTRVLRQTKPLHASLPNDNLNPPHNTTANPFAWATAGLADLELFERQLKGFVPPDAFDAHAHLWRVPDLGAPPSPMLAAGPAEVTRAVYDSHVSQWLPGRCPTGGLFFPFPARTLDVDAANLFLADRLRHDPRSRGMMMITPKHLHEARALFRRAAANPST